MVRKPKQDTRPDKFERAARELGCDEDPAHFDAALKKVARHKPTISQKPKKEKDDDAGKKSG